MISKELSSSTFKTSDTSAKPPLNQKLILFSESEFGDKCFSVFARVLGFGAVLGSLAFAAWGILHSSL